MDRVKRYSKVPVCAGFGIRSREQVDALRAARRRRGGRLGAGGDARARRRRARFPGIASRIGERDAAVKRVYRAASLLQVAHARNVLISAGVECELRNIHLAGAMGELPMMETWPQLYVARCATSATRSASSPAPPQAPGGAPGSARSAASSSSRSSPPAGAAAANGTPSAEDRLAAPEARAPHVPSRPEAPRALGPALAVAPKTTFCINRLLIVCQTNTYTI